MRNTFFLTIIKFYLNKKKIAKLRSNIYVAMNKTENKSMFNDKYILLFSLITLIDVIMQKVFENASIEITDIKSLCKQKINEQNGLRSICCL